jgi:ABC-2 type transport system ATP-binding protein
MEEAEYAHRLALMNRGRLIALDTPARLRASMREPILEVRTDDGPRAVEALRGAPGVLEVGLFGRAVHVAVEDVETARRAIVERLAAHGLVARAIVEVEPSLEDVFVARVRATGGALVE